MNLASDKRTIGVTQSGARVLADLMKTEQFATEVDAAKFAMAVAIRSGVGAGSVEGADTKWNVGTVDQDQSLRLIVESVYDNVTEPYRLIEHLMNQGFALLDAGPGIPPDVFATMFEQQPA